jgi:hypothetical protein
MYAFSNAPTIVGNVISWSFDGPITTLVIGNNKKSATDAITDYTKNGNDYNLDASTIRYNSTAILANQLIVNNTPNQVCIFISTSGTTTLYRSDNIVDASITNTFSNALTIVGSVISWNFDGPIATLVIGNNKKSATDAITDYTNIGNDYTLDASTITYNSTAILANQLIVNNTPNQICIFNSTEVTNKLYRSDNIVDSLITNTYTTSPTIVGSVISWSFDGPIETLVIGNNKGSSTGAITDYTNIGKNYTLDVSTITYKSTATLANQLIINNTNQVCIFNSTEGTNKLYRSDNIVDATTSTFYITQSLTDYFNTSVTDGGQSYTVINSHINYTKKLIVPFGGNGIVDLNTGLAQQGTSEAHCYFVTSIINQYIKNRNNDTAISTTLIEMLIQSINFITEIVSVNNITSLNLDLDLMLSNMYFPPWEFCINGGALCAIAPWSAQDSNQQLLCVLLRLYIFNKSDQYLDGITSTGLITSAEAYTYNQSHGTSVFNYSISLVESEPITYNLKNIIEKYITDLTAGTMYGESRDGNFAYDFIYGGVKCIFFASGCTNASTNNSSTTNTNGSISGSGYKWPDYVSYYGYVLMKYYAHSESMTILFDNYDAAIENYINYVLDESAVDKSGNLSISNPKIGHDSGDGASATFNRLVYQIAELLEVYNKGDTSIGLTSSTITPYFTYYTLLCTIATNLFNTEQANNALSITYDSAINPTTLIFNYIDGVDGSTSYTLGTSVLSGYCRMISYSMMIQSGYITVTKRPSNVYPTGTWPTDPDTTNGLILDQSGEPSWDSPTVPDGFVNIIAINDIVINNDPISYWPYPSGYAGSFTITNGVISDKVFIQPILIPNNAVGYSFKLYYSQSSGESTLLPSTYYVENLSVTDLIGSNGLKFNLYEQVTNWEGSVFGNLMTYFNVSDSQYIYNTNNWSTLNSPYFAWSMMTLHMSNYKLNN